MALPDRITRLLPFSDRVDGANFSAQATINRDGTARAQMDSHVYGTFDKRYNQGAVQLAHDALSRRDQGYPAFYLAQAMAILLLKWKGVPESELPGYQEEPAPVRRRATFEGKPKRPSWLDDDEEPRFHSSTE